jgi:3-phosphoshikimate 1-carboxyvinyltransferase
MLTKISPTEEMPRDLSFCGDYKITQACLILGAFARGQVVLNNCNAGKDTARTVAFLERLGVDVRRNGSEIRIGGGRRPTLPADVSFVFDGGMFPLSLIIGLLAGLNESCSISYSKRINQDYIDGITGSLNGIGIDILHEADEQLVVIRAGAGSPVEIRISSSLSHLKNCLLAFGVSSGRSVAVRETRLTSNRFEKCLERLGGSITVNRPKPVLREDPRDPRKKIRAFETDYRQEIVLAPAVNVLPVSMDIPCDSDIAIALMTLAVLKRREVTIPRVSFDRAVRGFLNFLKASGVEATVGGGKDEAGMKSVTVTLQGKDLKPHKTSGEQASALIDDVPFLAILSAFNAGTSIIRGITEFSDSGIEPFGEIAEKLERMGVKCGILPDGLVVEGAREREGTDFGSFGNRKIALAFYVAALACQGPSTFENFEIISEHYPDFVSGMRNVSLEKLFSDRESG